MQAIVRVARWFGKKMFAILFSIALSFVGSLSIGTHLWPFRVGAPPWVNRISVDFARLRNWVHSHEKRLLRVGRIVLLAALIAGGGH